MIITKSGRNTFPIFERPGGKWSLHPATREEALERKMGVYEPDPPVRCSCGYRLVRFVDESVAENYCCQMEVSIDRYNQRLKEGLPYSAKVARLMNQEIYYTHLPCKKCGHPGTWTLNGKCAICTKGSPRQEALRHGAKSYVPLEPCPKCGKIAEKLVASGACTGCKPPAEKPYYRMFPDMLLSYEDAKAAKLVAYRTGKPCKYGHTGWRWVSTRGCLTCQGRD